MGPWLRALADAWCDAARDLVLGSACVGCGAPGRVLCRACETTLPDHGEVCWPTPTPPGLAAPFTGGAYDGLLKALVNEHKERAVFALARPLGGVLAAVTADLVARAGARAGGPVWLVPVPSRRAVVCRRGHDPLLRVSRAAARVLRRRGIDASVHGLLRSRRRVRDQSLLGATERAVNLAGSMSCRRAVAPARAVVVVLDDVITTGATAREAQRALECAGVVVSGVATVAATLRLGRRDPGRGPSEQSLPFSRSDD